MTRRSTRHARRWLLGAASALVAACPAAASAAPVTGPAIGGTPTTALVTATGAGPDAVVAYGVGAYDGQAAASFNGEEFLLSGLLPNTTYHYRVETATGAGADRTLKTSAAGAPEMTARPTATPSNGAVICTQGRWSSPAYLQTVSWWQDGNQLTSVGATPSLVSEVAGDYACRVTMTSGTATSFMTSRPVHYTPPPPQPPLWVDPPSILGELPAVEGTVLTCDRGQWIRATTLEPGWLRDGVSLGEAQGTHRVTAADMGHTIVCQVTATGAGGTTIARSAPITPTAPVVVSPAPAPSATVATATARPVVNAASSSSTPPPNPVLVGPLDGTSGTTFQEDSSSTGVSASAALRTLLASRLPSRRALLRPDGARMRFRAPSPLGMLRVKLLGGDGGETVLAVGARWYDTSRTGVVRLRLTTAGRKALRSGTPLVATLVAIFVPDHGRSERESRQVVLRG